MREAILVASLCALCLGWPWAARSQRADVETLKRTAGKFSFFVVLDANEEKPARYLFADAREHVHVYEMSDGKPKLEWESTSLGARASALFVTDLDANGQEEMVIASASGRILIYDLLNYDLLWENHQDRFESIDCMTSANIDGDPQEELVIVGDSYLSIFDGLSKTREWQSQREFQADIMLLGNLDDDDQLEIILNTGFVIDSRFYTVEFESKERFGDRITLLDTNGDGIPEIIGELSDFTLRIYDIYAERELW
jgi:hypothetical protein